MKKAMKIRTLVGLMAGVLLCVPLSGRSEESMEEWNLKRWVEETVKMRFEGGCVNAKITLESIQEARDPIYKLLPVSVPLYNNYCTIKGLQLNLEQLGLPENEARIVAGKISRMNKKEFIEYFEKASLKFVDSEEKIVFDVWDGLTNEEKKRIIGRDANRSGKTSSRDLRPPLGRCAYSGFPYFFRLLRKKLIY